MIARIWIGETKPQYLEEYSEFLRRRAVPDYQSTPGHLALQFLRRIESNAARFLLITYWDSIDSVKRFAGEDFERAKYYAEDKKYLLSFPDKVEHYEVFAVGESSK